MLPNRQWYDWRRWMDGDDGDDGDDDGDSDGDDDGDDGDNAQTKINNESSNELLVKNIGQKPKNNEIIVTSEKFQIKTTKTLPSGSNIASSSSWSSPILGQYFCVVCKISFKKVDENDQFHHMINHMKVDNLKNPYSQSNDYVCSFCGLNFNRRTPSGGIVEHLKKAHKEGIDFSQMRFQCKDCELYFTEEILPSHKCHRIPGKIVTGVTKNVTEKNNQKHYKHMDTVHIMENATIVSPFTNKKVSIPVTNLSTFLSNIAKFQSDKNIIKTISLDPPPKDINTVTEVTTTEDAMTNHDNFDDHVTNENVDPLALDLITDPDISSDPLTVHEGQKNPAIHEEESDSTKVEDFQTCFIKMENSDSLEQLANTDT